MRSRASDGARAGDIGVGGGLARFELRRSGGNLDDWLKVSYRHDESSDGNYVRSWGYFKPGVTRKGADYDVGRSPGTVTARVTGPSDPLCTGNNNTSSCTDNYMVGNPSSASMQVTASASSSDAAAAADEALAAAEGLTPDEAAALVRGGGGSAKPGWPLSTSWATETAATTSATCSPGSSAAGGASPDTHSPRCSS